MEFHVRVQGPRQGKEVANPDSADKHTGKAMFVPDSQRCVQGRNWTHTTPAFLFAASDHFSFIFNARKTWSLAPIQFTLPHLPPHSWLSISRSVAPYSPPKDVFTWTKHSLIPERCIVIFKKLPSADFKFYRDPTPSLAKPHKKILANSRYSCPHIQKNRGIICFKTSNLGTA